MNIRGSAFDFHIHSRYSYDSLTSPERILRTAEKKHLGGIAITDHNTIKGALEAQKKSGVLQVIIGEEINTDRGEIIGLFLNEEVKGREFFPVIDEIRNQGGLVVLPHPFKKNIPPQSEILPYIDLIEARNGRRTPGLNVLAMDLATREKIPVIGGSDAHVSREIGSVTTVINQDIVDIEDLRGALLAGKGIPSGTESSPWYHSVSVIVGSLKSGDAMNLVRITRRKLRRIY